MGFISQLIASGVGGAIGGSFVLWGVKAQFRRQSDSALGALRVEIDRNVEAAADMTQHHSASGGYLGGHADPGWLKHSIWDSQLPFIVQRLDQPTLLIVSRAYATLDAVPAMAVANSSRSFARGGWVEAHLAEIHCSFSDAQQALANLENRLRGSDHLNNRLGSFWASLKNHFWSRRHR
jgi:hypothetical protein